MVKRAGGIAVDGPKSLYFVILVNRIRSRPEQGQLDMAANDKTILVIDQNPIVADNVKSLIEFMDTPCVITANRKDWRTRLGERRLEALFVGPDFSDAEVNGLLTELSKIDPNVPIVMMQTDE